MNDRRYGLTEAHFLPNCVEQRDDHPMFDTELQRRHTLHRNVQHSSRYLLLSTDYTCVIHYSCRDIWRRYAGLICQFVVSFIFENNPFGYGRKRCFEKNLFFNFFVKVKIHKDEIGMNCICDVVIPLEGINPNKI